MKGKKLVPLSLILINIFYYTPGRVAETIAFNIESPMTLRILK